MGGILLIVRLLLGVSGFLHGVHLNDTLLMQVTTHVNANGSGTLAMDVGINNYAFDALSMFRDPLQGFRQTGQASGAVITPFGSRGYKGWTMTNTFSSPAGMSALDNTPLYRSWCVVSTTGSSAAGYTVRMVYDGAGFAPLSTRLRLANLITLRYRTAAPGHLIDGPSSVHGQLAAWPINLVNDRQVVTAAYVTATRQARRGSMAPGAGTPALLAILATALAGVAIVLLLVASRYRRLARMQASAALVPAPPSATVVMSTPQFAAAPLAPPPTTTTPIAISPAVTAPMAATSGASNRTSVFCRVCHTEQPPGARFCNNCGLPIGLGPPISTPPAP